MKGETHFAMRLHSVKLPHFNNAAEQITAALPTPKRVIISMSQHGGVPCTPLVKVGDEVKTGQLIGSSDAVISAPVHASISGRVTAITDVMSVAGRVNQALVIEAGETQEMSEEIAPPAVNSREDFIAAVKKSGSVGLGGAGFPTYVKLNYDRKTTNIDTIVVNGAECEPYITSDYRTLMEEGEKVIDGIKLLMKWLEIPSCVIGIEADKPKAIENMKKLAGEGSGITVKSLKPQYPQGAEKVLIFKCTGRVVREGELPMAAGCLVMNVSTIAFISDYIKTGVPLIKRRLTIDGNIVKKPSNVIVPIGTPLSDLLDFAEVSKEPDRVIFGGPMMGSCVYDRDMPTAKTNNAVLLFADTVQDRVTECIRCGRCIRACSMNLAPTELEHAYDARDKEELIKLKVNLCMNCGACTFVCPAKRNLAEKNQLAKIFLRESK